jgi:hypothetical protein
LERPRGAFDVKSARIGVSETATHVPLGRFLRQQPAGMSVPPCRPRKIQPTFQLLWRIWRIAAPQPTRFATTATLTTAAARLLVSAPVNSHTARRSRPRWSCHHTGTPACRMTAGVDPPPAAPLPRHSARVLSQPEPTQICHTSPRRTGRTASERAPASLTCTIWNPRAGYYALFAPF